MLPQIPINAKSGDVMFQPGQFYVVEVEYMDGRIEPFPVGGMVAKPEVVENNVLYLWKKDGEMADLKAVASIPLVNIRKWERMARK